MMEFGVEVLMDIGESIFRRGMGHTAMPYARSATAQAVADLAQGVGVGQLAEQHRDQLGPAAKAFGAPFGVVFLDQRSELSSGKMLEQLIEQTGYLYDWSALLLGFGARIGTSRTNRFLPPSIIGGPLLEPGNCRAQLTSCLGQECLKTGSTPSDAC